MTQIINTHSTIGNQLGVFPLPIIRNRDPSSIDYNFPLTQMWLNKTTTDLFMLVSKAPGSTLAVWQLIGVGGGDIATLSDDAGLQVSGVANDIALLGGALINTVGTNPGSITFNLDQGDDGEIIIAKTGDDSEYGTLISTDSSITITPDVSTPGAFTIDLEVGAAVATQYTPSEGTSPVILTGNNLNLTAGANMRTIGSADTVTFSLVDAVNTLSYETSDAAENILIQANQIVAGGTNPDIDIDITPQGTGNVNVLSGTVSISSFGLGAVLSDASGDLSSVNGTDGQLLIAGTGLIPAWANLTSTGSTITITPGVNTLNIETAGTISDSFPTDAGTATPSAGELDILGGSNINTAGATNQVTVNLDDTVTISGTFTTTGGSINVGTTTPANPYDIAIEQTVDGLIGQSIQNLSVGASAGANLQMIGEPGTGDLFTIYSVNGATTWSTGVDNSDSDSLKFTTGSSPSAGTEAVVLTTAGVVNFPQYGAGALLSTSAGLLSSDNGSAGQVLTANGAGLLPTWQNSSTSMFAWQVVAGSTQALVAGNGYFANNATDVTFTLPATAAVGDTFEICAMHATGTWTVDCNAGQTLYIGNTNATTTSGTLMSTDTGDWITIVCRVADTDFQVKVEQGNIDIT